MSVSKHSYESFACLCLPCSWYEVLLYDFNLLVSSLILLMSRLFVCLCSPSTRHVPLLLATQLGCPPSLYPRPPSTLDSVFVSFRVSLGCSVCSGSAGSGRSPLVMRSAAGSGFPLAAAVRRCWRPGRLRRGWRRCRPRRLAAASVSAAGSASVAAAAGSCSAAVAGSAASATAAMTDSPVQLTNTALIEQSLDTFTSHTRVTHSRKHFLQLRRVGRN